MKLPAALVHRLVRLFAIAALLLPATLCAQGPGPQAPAVRLRLAAEVSSTADLLQTGAAGRTLATGGFDEDGVPDLVTGYATRDGGRITVQRGNVDAIYPNSAEANARRERGEFTAAAFFPAPGSVALADAADFVGAGDFDADGHWDIVAAGRGGTKLYWLRGNGRGNFGAPASIDLGGNVTAFATGEVNRVDGLTDVAIGIATADGARVLVFEGAEGALRRAPESFAVPAAVNDLALGNPRAPFLHDLAIASGNEVVVVQGRDRKLSLDAEAQARVAPAQVSQTAFATAVQSVAFGDFAGDAAPELAVLTAGGELHVGGSAVRVATAPTARLMRAKVSTLQKDDLLVVGGGSAVQVVTAAPAAGSAQTDGAQLSIATSVSTSAEVNAVLPMRLNADALNDLVVLNDDSAVVVETHGGVFVVNTTATTSDNDRGDGICADDAAACSFAAAIEEANAHSGADTIHFNVPGGGVPVVSPTFGQVITGPVTIDGTTQPGGRVEVVLGGTPGSSANILTLSGGNSVVRGLALYAGAGNVVAYQINITSSGNIIEGNYIGFRADGTAPSGIPSPAQGGPSCINSTTGGSNNLVGGTTAAARNVISNCRETVNITSGAGNSFQGNYIGTNPAGTAALANYRGILARDTVLTLGGTAPGAGNVISATGNPGAQGPLEISGTSSVVVQANRFGTTADGMQPIANLGAAIEIFSNEPVTIGGTTPAARNIVSASPWGIRVRHDSGGATVIQGNYVGTNAAGTGALPNLESGVLLGGTRGVVIGGSTAGAGNLISGNAKNGLDLTGGINGTPCRGVIIEGNLIGTDVSGTVALPNLDSGIDFSVTDNSRIGGTAAGARNVISGNAKNGIIVGFAGTNIGRIQANLIGLNIFGTGALGNGQHGISMNSPGGHQIGGREPGAGNFIAFNGGAGIAAPDRDLIGGPVLSNSIFANRGVGLDRNGDGATTNFNQRYSQTPEITSVTSSGSETIVNGTLRTTTFGPQGPFTIQFFSNTSPDPTGYGEGQTLVGETTITAGQSVAVPFSATLPAVPPGRYLSAVAIGVYDTANNGRPLTSEFSFNVRVPGDASNNPLHISALTPSVGGDTGVVTVTIIGEGIQEGAVAVLRRAGQPDVVGIVVDRSPDGSTVQATFDLTGKLRGGYQIVVTNPGGANSTIADAFTVEAGGKYNVYVDVVGPELVRVGRNTRFLLSFGNTGNTDAPTTKLTVSVPKSLFEVARRPEFPAGSPAFITEMNESYLMELYIPRIPANSGEALEFQVKAIATAPDRPNIIATAYPSQAFQSIADRPVDPRASVSIETVTQTAASERLVMHVTSSRGSVDVPVEITRTSAPGPKPPRISVLPDGDNTKIVYEVTRPGSVNAISREASLGTNSTEYPEDTPGFFSELVTLYYQGGARDDGVLNVRDTLGDQLLARHSDAAAANRLADNQLLRDRGLVERDTQRSLNTDASAPQPLNLLENARTDLNGKSPISPQVNDVYPKRVHDDYERNRQLYEKELRIARVREIALAREGSREGMTDAELLDSLDQSRRNQGDLSPLEDLILNFKPVFPTSSHDPNDKAGPSGPSPGRFISGLEPLSYVVLFENKPEATAPAQDVVITDQLDVTKFDLNTFQLGTISFGKGVAVTPPPGLSEWTTDIDLRPTNNLLVRVSGSLDKSTGLITWRFISLDPATLQPTENAAAGFLPPNKNAPEGDGAVSFRVNAKPALAAGTEIRNKARIVFDVNAPIDTPEWLNTIDNTPPVSQVVALPATSSSSSFEIRWSGTDEGAGVQSYAIYVSENGGAYTLWRNTTATSGIFYGRPNASYSFYSVAEDGGGNRETPPVQADASTFTLAGQLLNISTRMRVQGGDNVLIGGMIVTGNDPKRVILRALGGSLANVPGALQDPVLELYQAGQLVAFNDNWRDTQQGEIEGSTIPPTNELESAIVHTLAPGFYTAVMKGKDGSSGIGVVEAYDLDQGANSKLANISSRGFVESGDNIMIGGVIAGGSGGGDTRVLIRAIGPSLETAGITGALQDPTLELRDPNGALISANDNWQESQQIEIEATTIPPTHAAESAMVATLPPGFYTAVVRGKNGGTGIAVVEAYNVP